jgi:hypothetical protein
MARTISLSPFRIKHSVRETGLLQQESDPQEGQRRLFRAFHDHTISERECIGNGPVRHHRREIEGHDGSDDAERRVFRTAFHAAGYFQDFACHELGKRGGEFGELDTFLDLGDGFAQGLAVLAADERSEFLRITFQQGLIPVKDLHPLFYRRLAPGRKNSGGRLNSIVKINRR